VVVGVVVYMVLRWGMRVGIDTKLRDYRSSEASKNGERDCVQNMSRDLHVSAGERIHVPTLRR